MEVVHREPVKRVNKVWRDAGYGIKSPRVAGYGHKITAGCGIREILKAGYGMKIAWRDRDAFISIGEMRDSFEIDSGTRDFKSK